MNDFFGAVAVVLAAMITGAGAYVGVSLRRQLRTRVSERRLTAYAALWQVTRKAAPSRQDSLTEAERMELFEVRRDDFVVLPRRFRHVHDLWLPEYLL